MKEKAVLLGKDRSLVGIITEPSSASGRNSLPAIILLNAGMLHRVGPNRLYVKIARKMAESGYMVLRFDFSGIGDSDIRRDNLPFEKSVVSETQEAMDYLSSAKHIRRFILAGICSGAAIAFKTACCDLRVIGGIFINGYYDKDDVATELGPYTKNRPQERNDRRRLFNYKRWWRVIPGRSNSQSIRRGLAFKLRGLLTRSVEAAHGANLAAVERLVMQRGVELLLVYSEGNPAWDTFRGPLEDKVSALGPSGKLRVEIIEDTDHLFTLPWSQELLVDLVHQWALDKERAWFSGQSIVTLK